MKKVKFRPPRVLINRVYTRKGDQGETSLVGGQRVSKDSLRIQAYGTVDELNAFVGLARQTLQEQESRIQTLSPLSRILSRVQHELFNLGSVLATESRDMRSDQPRIMKEDIQRLEEEIDRMNCDLPELRSFVLPGGSRIDAELHLCRTVCRRAERLCVSLAHEDEICPEIVPYLNRLGDAFFVWSRWTSKVLGQTEILWNPNQDARVD